jgi:hypothetical protein
VQTAELCLNCGEPIAIRNPTGHCDHLYYPEYRQKYAVRTPRERYSRLPYELADAMKKFNSQWVHVVKNGKVHSIAKDKL